MYMLLTWLTIFHFPLTDKVRLSNQRKDIEREMKELKETGGSRIRKVDVEELRRKAARLGMLYFYCRFCH